MRRRNGSAGGLRSKIRQDRCHFPSEEYHHYGKESWPCSANRPTGAESVGGPTGDPPRAGRTGTSQVAGGLSILITDEAEKFLITLIRDLDLDPRDVFGRIVRGEPLA